MQDERTDSSVSPATAPQASEVLLSEDHQQGNAGGTAVAERSTLGSQADDAQRINEDAPMRQLGVDGSFTASVPADHASSAAARPSADTSSTTTAATAAKSAAESGDAVSTRTLTSTAVAAPPASEARTEAPVAVGNPYRRRSSRHAKPKSILKPPPPPQAKFSFRRDVLGYVVGETAPLPSLNPINAAFNLANGTQINKTPSDGPASARSPASVHATHSSKSSEFLASPTAPHQNISLSRPAAGLWKRLGGAVTAVAGSMPVPQSAVKTLNSFASAVRPANASEHPAQDTTLPDHHTDGTSRGGRVQQAANTDSLKAEYVKSVRFTMSSLSVIYPINGPGPPGVEAATRRRINKEHLARQEYRVKKGGWTTLDLLDLYEECCRTREEPGIAPLRTMLMVSLNSEHHKSHG